MNQPVFPTPMKRLVRTSQAIILGLLGLVMTVHAAAPVDMTQRTEELKSLKWGMFICWSFSTFSGKEWTPGVKDVGFFAAKDCDTDQWARTAKEAGMGYILFLTKHHDGFCLWDTKTTDRKVTKAPLGRDVLSELKKSCDKYGIKLALYFSEGEWASPDKPDGTRFSNNGGYDPELKKAQLKELLTQFGPIEYIWFDHAVGDGGLSHADTVAFCKALQAGCFLGFNHGDQAAADIRVGEMGKPGSLDDHKAAGPHMRDPAGKNYRLAEFTYPILPKHKGGAMWFYSLPQHDKLCFPAEKLYQDYLGAVKFGNIFALDVGPDSNGKLRDIDVTTLRQVGAMIKNPPPVTSGEAKKVKADLPTQASAIIKPLLPWQDVESFDQGWLYLEKDVDDIPSEGDWQAISLPHCWNAADSLMTNSYRRGNSWYRHALKVTAGDLRKRLFLRFGAAGMDAAVFVNGVQATKHLGAYSAFTLELTKLLKPGDNQIDVKVCNRGNPSVPPVADGLFNFYGGLYRSVQLIRAPATCIARDHRGGPGVRVWSEKVSDQLSRLNVQVWLSGLTDATAPMTCLAELSDASGRIVSKGETPALGGWVRIKMSDVKQPDLWSPEHPVLYHLTVKLIEKGAVIDRVAVRHGFRWFEFTADRGFFLNGKPYKLHGLSRHQDAKGLGNAVPPEHHLKDIRLMKELGVNWLRLAHYQQDDYVLQLCDELGLLVWEEIPFVNDSPRTAEFEANSEAMLLEMIEQHFNHPAIVLWGMGNEIWLGKGADGKALEFDFISRLNDAIHREDPVRKSVIVCDNDNYYSNLKIMTLPDVIAYNLYCGWYGGTVDKLSGRLSDLHGRDPSKPLILSEFGAGCDLDKHSESPKCFDQTQEYQLYFLESYLRQLDAMPWLAGYNWWNFADFGWANSKIPKFYNNKGLVTFDRQKKDSFYFVKAAWTKEPVLYLCSPTWTERTGLPDKPFKVISNMHEVELFLNGKTLGKQTAGFIWNVKLVPGKNLLLARGERNEIVREDGFTVTYTPGDDPNSGKAPADLLKQAIDSNPVKDQK